MYAEIAVNAAVNQTFDYNIPPELEPRLKIGHLVQVPFGTALQHGIVLTFRETTDVPYSKDIQAILDPQPVVNDLQIELARWISEQTLSPIGFCLWLMLPPGLTGGRDIRVTLMDDEAISPDDIEHRVLDLLRRRSIMTGRRMEAHKTLHGLNWRAAVDALAKEGIVYVERILTPPRVRPRSIQTALLSIHPDQIHNVTRHLGKESKQADVLEALFFSHVDHPFVHDILEMADVATASPLTKLAQEGLVAVDKPDKKLPATVSLTIPRESVMDEIIRLRKAETDLHVLKVLARHSEPVDVQWLYAQTGTKLADLKRLEEEELILLGEKQTWRDSLADRYFVPNVAPPLTPEQATVWKTLEQHIKNWGWGKAANELSAGLFLLRGVTGSGKTEIYLRAIELTLAQGRGAIFLVPEIALTAQTIRRVASRFPGQVAIVHSGLSEGERYDTWRRAKQGLVQVVVGARSALFTPLPDVGLVILDEAHDNSYKQSPPIQPPYYHARAVAEQMMRLNHGTLILGSATPELESVYRAHQGELKLLELPTRIMGHRIRILEQSERTGVNARYYPARAEDALAIDLPPVQVVDMREELKDGNTSIFSYELQEAITDVLKRKEQAILFINRRGESTYVFCRDCGYVAACPRCDTPLTFHRQSEALRCHRCGYAGAQPTTCPECSSKRIKYFGAGTQHIEAALHEQFPKARTLRWDADTATTPESHELFLQRFIDRKVDIMIGTQMVAKGLDLPLVTLVGVVSADMGLNLPDFRAGERSFQLLMQVAGRAGRGLLGGRVILQTYQPSHYAIKAAAKHDFEGFYNQEIEYRRDLGYPPFRKLARILIRDESDTRARAEAESAANLLKARIAKLNLSATEIVGPAPCFFSRVNKVYRWHVLLRGPDPSAALRGVDIPRGWYVDLDPVDVL
ncbi:MAG: primosomal protein N' [Anaerolineae bacterium]